GIPVYEYYFTKANGRIGAFHSGEEIYAYANIPEQSKLFDEKDRELMRIMSSYWVNFAVSGDPNGADVPEWPKNADNDTLLELGENVRTTGEKPRKAAFFEVLDRMQGFGE
ncbi:MAG: carboxylesterase family protein, partial [Lachnospiraceae bacterium]|nr:carboxylesterase family protein [Lachnospiraceae bacterium]